MCSLNKANLIFSGLRPAISTSVCWPQALILGSLTPPTSKILRCFFNKLSSYLKQGKNIYLINRTSSALLRWRSMFGFWFGSNYKSWWFHGSFDLCCSFCELKQSSTVLLWIFDAYVPMSWPVYSFCFNRLRLVLT